MEKAKNQKTRILIFLILIPIIMASKSISAQQTGCCTPPSPTTCFEALSESSCPNYFLEGEQCSSLLICQYNPGCCTDTCTDVSYIAQCMDHSSFKQRACSQQEACQQGCCVCGSESAINICRKDITYAECQQRCSEYVGYSVKMYDSSIHGDQCLNNCQSYGGEKSTITGTVYNINKQPVPNAEITAAGKSAVSSSIGKYTLSGIPSGNVLVTAKYQGSVNATYLTIPLTSAIIIFNPILPPAPGNTIKGIVTSGNTPLKDALINLIGPVHATILTDSQGKYEFNYLSDGTYRITASKTNYISKEQTKTVSGTAILEVSFNLNEQAAGTVSGITKELNGIPIAYSKIYVDDILKTYSDAAGHYSVALPLGSYAIYSAKAGYYKSQTELFTFSVNGQTEQIDLGMESITSDCAGDNAPPVLTFLANHVKGKKAVQLQWSPKNCNNIEGYRIYKQEQLFKFIKPRTTTFFADYDVSWQELYNYQIEVVYNDKPNKISSRLSSSITLGNEKCENKYLPEFGRFSEFCDGDFQRKTCDNENKVKNAPLSTAVVADCRDLGNNFYCSGPHYQGYTYCKDRSACDPRNQDALPFGLYYNEDSCYGTDNYCYYDYTATIPDKCYECSQDMTCFDYKNQNACSRDSCLAASLNSTCAWITIPVYFELGKGICYQTNYRQTDQCYRCSSQAGFFINTKCTQDVCSKLGNCYANQENTECISCENPVCEDFKTKEQCEGTPPQSIIVDKTCPLSVTDSNSACGLKKCRWASNKCVKDGDGDGVADCTTDNCRRDLISPVSTPPLEGVININENTEIEFTIADENDGKLYYCFDLLNNICCPVNNADYYSEEGLAVMRPFESQLLHNLYNTNRQGTYNLCYYAQDAFKNIEQIKCSTVWVDFTPPQINLNYEIIKNATGTYPPKSNLKISITLDDEATCTDSLKRINAGLPNKINNQKKSGFNITYSNLDDGDYEYKINCQDDLGNIASAAEYFTIDAYRLISVITPKGAVKNPVIFNISTQDKAGICTLIKDNIEIEELNNDLSEKNFWSRQYTLNENRHYSNYAVECIDAFDLNKIDRAFFDFTIDNFGPTTAAIIKVNNIEKNKFNISSWQSWQKISSSVTLECSLSLIGGFICNRSYYCITDKDSSCSPVNLYSSPMQISETKKILYYSTDKGQNQEPVKQGILYIGEGLGIQLLNPVYGVTNKPLTNLLIKLPIDTEECKFAFDNFNYNDLKNPDNLFTKISDTEFKISGFPYNPAKTQFVNEDDSKTIWVKCRTKSGFINEDLPEIITIEYDPTPPNIEQAFFNPAEVVQGSSTILTAKIDDKARCIFERKSDNVKYESAGYSSNPPIFSAIQNLTVAVSIGDDQKTHYWGILCQNRALNYSSQKTASFSVDFSIAGTIIDLLPKGSINSTQLTLIVKTNKNANCKYQEGSLWIDFTTGPLQKTVHESAQKSLLEGSYSYPVKCSIIETGSDRTAQISFKVDTTPPVMNYIDDGDYACNPSRINPQFSANDSLSNIKNYAYQLLTQNNSLIINWTETDSSNPSIPASLTEGRSYYLKAKAQDEAGWWSSEIASNGFTAEDPNSDECSSDTTPPRVIIKQDPNCRTVKIEIICTDPSSCSQKLYNAVNPGESCDPVKTYNNIIEITKTSLLCYKISDQLGNSETGNLTINISDSDGDGIVDSCDKCPKTSPGILVTEDGCPPVESDCDCSYGIDLDIDGYGLNCKSKIGSDDSICYDCDDTQRSIHINCQNGCMYDGDGDSYGIGCDAGPDCNDRNENIHLQEECISGCIQDTDDDKYGPGCYNGLDCNDLDPTIHSGCLNKCVQDTDGDNYGLGCKLGSDCDDFNSDITNSECTSGCTNDLDCDGISDDWETANGLNPNSPEDALLDPDEDGKTNIQEYRDNTDPKVPNLLIPEKQKNILKPIFIILGIVLILTGAGYVSYKNYFSQYFFKKPKPIFKPKSEPIKTQLYRPQPAQIEIKSLSEERRRKKAIELIKNRIREKKEKKEKFFEIFGKPKIKTKLTQKEIQPLAEKITLPEKHEFKKLKQFLETYETKDLKSKSTKEILNKLNSIIKKKSNIPKSEKPTPKQKKKVKDILYQILNEKIKQQKLPEDLEKLRKLSRGTGKS